MSRSSFAPLDLSSEEEPRYDKLHFDSASTGKVAPGNYSEECLPATSDIVRSPGWGTWAIVDASFNTQPSPTNLRPNVGTVLSPTTKSKCEVRIRIGDDELVIMREPVVRFDHRTKIKVFIMIVAQIALTLSTIGSITTGASSHFSPMAKFLLDFAKFCNIIAFICFIYGILVCDSRNPGVAARIFTGIGVVMTTYGILAVMCMELVYKQGLQLFITVTVFIACIPALATAFRR
ncbi:hypothetical protein Patl1_26590 [Pistacia atlantica]|uniref:Uncharacterized protein n=1 Tax=Pistacia atlantica TaxID=434234 RepID=A0ACC1B2Y3_9ROSI|nr:hypothetical protein Patl1_26590 [Pistacia atlantica]